ncbi:hypothetical protein Hanom_Chr17g01574981 [Helianthus anomalus]
MPLSIAVRCLRRRKIMSVQNHRSAFARPLTNTLKIFRLMIVILQNEFLKEDTNFVFECAIFSESLSSSTSLSLLTSALLEVFLGESCSC